MKERFICSLLWEHLSIHPHGHSSPCCEVEWSSPLAFAKNKIDGEFTQRVLNVENGIENVINSDAYKQIRLEMLNGQIPSACTTCYKVEQNGGISKRLREKAPDVDYRLITAEDGSIKPSIKNLELRLGNYCNLKCRSCNAESSTSWIDDYHKLKHKVNLPSAYDDIVKSDTTSYDWVDSYEFYEEIFNNAPNLELLQVSGGEPFLVDKHSHLLQLLIDSGRAEHMTVSYITNANYKFDRIKPILDKLTKFKNVTISISLDDVYKRNDYIRSLSNFQLTINNIKRYIDEYNFTYSITQTVNAFNFFYIEELSQFLVAEGLFNFDRTGPIQFINDNYVFSPDYQSANIFPKELRQQKIDSIKGLIPDYFYMRLKGHFYNPEPNGKLGEFITTTAAVDEVRREKFELIFPEIANIIKTL